MHTQKRDHRFCPSLFITSTIISRNVNRVKNKQRKVKCTTCMEPIITLRSVRWHHLPRNKHSPTGTFCTSGFEVLAPSISQVNWFFSLMTQSRNLGMSQRSTRDQTGHPGFLVAKDQLTPADVTDGLSEDCEAKSNLHQTEQTS